MGLHIQNAEGGRLLALDSNDEQSSPKSLPKYVTEALSHSSTPPFLVCEKGITNSAHQPRLRVTGGKKGNTVFVHCRGLHK